MPTASARRRDPACPSLDTDPVALLLLRHFTECRRRTVELTDGLSDADATAQSMVEASPAKWHLAHTTWYFEAFVLADALDDYRPFDPRFAYLFNSYYDTIGDRLPRPQRGMLTRPGLDTVLRYREHVDHAVEQVLERLLPGEGSLTRSGPLAERAEAWRSLIELGIQHEQQHQELLLTDLLHLFSLNPLSPVYRPAPEEAGNRSEQSAPTRFVPFDGGRCLIGHSGRGFAYDCEGPRHEVLLHPFALADRPVSNGDWREFIDDGGYRSALLWLSDGWDRVRLEGWEAPLYWRRDTDRAWRAMTLHGERALDAQAPVAHISYYEADAFARWAGKRLPTEFEWEAAARAALARGGRLPARDQDAPVADGHFADDRRYLPMPSGAARLDQLFGDVWEWTASAFAPYPGFRAVPGAVGEYNGKFMCGQYVLRGGSCATPRGHVRSTYRNFFPPHARWQFSGVRLAEDRS